MSECRVIDWEGRSIRLSYVARYCGVIDHVEIRAEDGAPLPITETGYKSKFFGPIEPPMSMDEVVTQVRDWLDGEASKPKWQAYCQASRQLSLF